MGLNPTQRNNAYIFKRGSQGIKYFDMVTSLETS